MSKRVIGIDIIKILAIIFVPTVHFFTNYGFVGEAYVGWGKILQESIRWLSFSCIGLFIMSTGYLQCNKIANSAYFKKIIKYIIPTLIYAILTAAINGREDLFKNTMYYFLQLPSYFWYISFFLGFYLLIPYLNIIINNIQDKRRFQGLIVVLLVVTAIPEFVNGLPALFGTEKILYLPGWWGQFFPITYYVLGAYFRKFTPQFSKKLLLLFGLIAVVGISLIDYHYSSGGLPHFYGGGYGSIIAVIITVITFSLLYNLDTKIKTVKTSIAYLSGITLEIYLGFIFAGTLTRKIVNLYFPNLTSSYTYKLFFIAVPIEFLISTIIAIVITTAMKIVQMGMIKVMPNKVEVTMPKNEVNHLDNITK